MDYLSVTIRLDGKQVASLVMSQMPASVTDETSDYEITCQIEKGNDVVSVHRRLLETFPYKALNSVALLKAALGLFEADSLGLEDDDDTDEAPGSPVVERGQLRTLREIQAGPSSLRNH